MSYFIGDDGKKYTIFGEGGVKRTAEEFEEFLENSNRSRSRNKVIMELR